MSDDLTTEWQGQPIAEFEGPYRFLSNFFAVEIEYLGLWFGSSEAAYQAAKSTNFKTRQAFTVLPANAAKKLGRTIEIREDWEDIKLDVMKGILTNKFENTSNGLGAQLLMTCLRELIEGKWWGDRFWGVCKGEGENHLGRLLMERRQELRDEQGEGYE